MLSLICDSQRIKTGTKVSLLAQACSPGTGGWEEVGSAQKQEDGRKLEASLGYTMNVRANITRSSVLAHACNLST